MSGLPKRCARQPCSQPALLGQRYCRNCAKYVLEELETAGYLQRQADSASYRPGSTREKVHETKFGSFHG